MLEYHFPHYVPQLTKANEYHGATQTSSRLRSPSVDICHRPKNSASSASTSRPKLIRVMQTHKAVAFACCMRPGGRGLPADVPPVFILECQTRNKERREEGKLRPRSRSHANGPEVQEERFEMRKKQSLTSRLMTEFNHTEFPNCASSSPN